MFMRKMLEGGVVPEAAEATLVLIPKETKPSNMCAFGPLSLCNVVYKLASKVIVNKLKCTLKDLISPCKASFVPSQQGNDNVVICREFSHSL